jgi:histone H3/H4
LAKKRQEKKMPKKNQVFKDITFVITGSLSRPRDEWIEEIEERGGNFSKKVTNKVDYVITTEKGLAADTQKIQDARDKGLPILSEEALIDAIDNGEWSNYVLPYELEEESKKKKASRKHKKTASESARSTRKAKTTKSKKSSSSSKRSSSSSSKRSSQRSEHHGHAERSLKPGIKNVLKQVHSKMSIAKNAGELVNDMLQGFASSVAKNLKKKKDYDVYATEQLESALKSAFGESKELLKHALNEGKKAVRGGGTTFATRTVSSLMKRYDTPLDKDATLFMTAVLEYLAAEILELAGNNRANQTRNRKRIQTSDIHYAIKQDTELPHVFDQWI